MDDHSEDRMSNKAAREDHDLNDDTKSKTDAEESRRLGQRKSKKASKRRTEKNDTTTLDSDESRRLERRRKRALKAAQQHLAEQLGLDEHGNELDNFALTKYPVRECTFTVWGMRDHVALNPVVTLLAIVVLWGLVVWCTVDPVNALAQLSEWRETISLNFTWLIHGTKAVYIFFMLYLAYKFGHIRLGGKDDKPEFSTLTYLCMILVSNCSNGLFRNAVLEPLSHQAYHFYANTGYRSQDELDMFAINLTVTDFGFGCWAPIAVVAVAMSLAVYRFRLPLSFRSCLHPVLGQYTWGWMGDAIDGVTIVATLANVVTTLGLAAFSLAAGFVPFEWIDAESAGEQLVAIQNSMVWVISLVTLVSVVSGLHGGIRLFCIVAMALGTVLWILVLFWTTPSTFSTCTCRKLVYTFNQASFNSTFGPTLLGNFAKALVAPSTARPQSSGGIPNGSTLPSSGLVASPVCGLFLCSISRGRKLWEVILYSLVVPVVYSLVWSCTWGGIGLRQVRQSLELEGLGVTLFNNTAHFIMDGNEFCYDVPQLDIVVEGETVFTNHLVGVTPVCKFNEENPDSAIFNILNSFRLPNGVGLGPILSLLVMLASTMFLMASAGAASLIVDKMASSGRKNDHMARRMFWLVTAAALTTALLSKGGEDAFSAMQSAIVVCGLPMAVLLCFALQAITLMCQQAVLNDDDDVGDYRFPTQPEFAMPVYGGIFNIFEYCASLGTANQARRDQGMDRMTRDQAVELVKGLFVPFVSLNQILSTAYPQNVKTNLVVVACYAACYIVWIGLCVASWQWPGLVALAWTMFVIQGGLLAMVRSSFRTRHNVRSNVVADVMSSLLLWPQVLSQMNLHQTESLIEIEADIVVAAASTTSDDKSPTTAPSTRRRHRPPEHVAPTNIQTLETVEC